MRIERIYKENEGQAQGVPLGSSKGSLKLIFIEISRKKIEEEACLTRMIHTYLLSDFLLLRL